MKKLSLYMLAFAGLFMTSCGLEDNEFASLTTVEADGTVALPGFAAVQADPVDLNAVEIGDAQNIKVFSISEAALPEGVVLSRAEIVFEDGGKIPATTDGMVSGTDLSTYVASQFGTVQELKTLKGTILLFASQNGSAVKINAGDINLQVMPKAPEFDPYIFFIGATDGWTASEQRLYSPDGDGHYTGFCYVADPNSWGLAFKFQKVAGSWDDEINTGTFESMEGVSGSGNIEVAEEGVYYFEIDLVKKSIKATKIEYMGVTGGFTGWNEGSQMTWNPTDYCFELTTATPIEGEWKFRANGLTDNDWKINLGGDKDDLTLGGGNLTISGKTIKLYPTRKTSDKIYCTVE